MFKLSLRLIIVENSCSKLHGVIPAMHLPVAVFLWSFNQDFQLSLQFSLIHSSESISGSRTFLISSGGCLSCCLNVSQTLSVTSTSTSISTNLCLCLYPFNSNVVLGVAGVGGAVAGEFHGVEDRSGENSSKKSKFTLSIHSSPTCLEAEVPSPVGSSKVSSHSSRKRDITLTAWLFYSSQIVGCHFLQDSKTWLVLGESTPTAGDVGVPLDMVMKVKWNISYILLPLISSSRCDIHCDLRDANPISSI